MIKEKLFKRRESNVETFFALLRAGIWEQDAQLLPYGKSSLSEVHLLAEEQSVVGLIAAGIEHVSDVKVAKEEVFPFIGQSLQLEQRNLAMNQFIGGLVEKMSEAGIYAVLIKGQGVAQCYARPLWRASGDVDFFFDAENYQKAKVFLSTLATKVETEDKNRLHLGMRFGQWVVELHGTMHTGISVKMNNIIDEVQNDIFTNEGVRKWKNDAIEINLPSPDNDVILVFTHYIGHFYGLGVGLRQICDWCRLLWTYKGQIDLDLLYRRLEAMNLLTEWKAFAAFAILYLGMPEEAMPFYDSSAFFKRKAARICKLILETGNMGHNKDESYRLKHSKTTSNIITFFRRLGEFSRIATIFPANSPKFFVTYALNRMRAVG